MGKAYRYALGVDLGIASIGTALVRLDADGTPAGVLDAGTRVFEIPLGGEERRQHRQARKTIRRRRQRIRKLLRVLRSQNMLPADAGELAALMRRNPYKLRAHGARNPFSSLHELGRCLMHMAKFRGAGFLSEAEEKEDGDMSERDGGQSGKSKQKYIDFYNNLAEQLEKSGDSLGEFFWKRIQNAEHKGRVRRRKRFIEERGVDYAVPRFLVKEDFSRIWETQALRFPALTESLREEVRAVIFTDRPHAPYACGTCSLDPDSGDVRLPRMHRLAEQRRIYEEVNNLRFKTNTAVHTLTKEMRDALVERCMRGEALNRSKIKQILTGCHDEKIESVNMPDDARTIKPHSHARAFADVPRWEEMSVEERDDLIAFIAEPRLNPKDPASPLMAEEDLLRECARRLGLDGPDATRQAARRIRALPRDRSMLGLAATMRTLEKLVAGTSAAGNGQAPWRPLTQREAADACGYLAEEEKHRAMAGTYDALPYYGEALRHDVTPVHPWHVGRATPEEARFGRIPNPVVHVALNQLRKVINEIVSLYGKPERIHVELAREFGMSKANRDKREREQKDREKANRKMDRDLLEKHGLPPTRKNRAKLRLWEEQERVDIYTLESLEPISAAVLEGCEIDHIIPRAAGGSDAHANLALTASSVNLAKGDSFAYAFIQRAFPERWQNILKKISGAKYPRNKAWRFMPEAESRFAARGDEDQTDHRMTDTSYMAKMAKRYLSLLCADVLPLRGGMIARLRRLWGLDGLEYDLMEMRIRREMTDPDTGEVVLDPRTNRPVRNPDWQGKPRIDHRHHAMDAVVVACAGRSVAQRLAKADRRGERIADLPPPFGAETGEFRRRVLDALKKIKTSPKPEHGLNGQLHNATKYRILGTAPGQEGIYLTLLRRKISDLKSKEAVRKLTDYPKALPRDMPVVRESFAYREALRNAMEAQYARAEEKLRRDQELARRDGGRIYTIKEEHIVREAARLARKENPALKHTYPVVENKTLVGVCLKKQCGVAPDNNHRVDFYVTPKGKAAWECITLFDANRRSFEPAWMKRGGRLLWSLHKGDVLELEVDEAMRKKLNMPVSGATVFCVVQKFSIVGTLQVNLLHDARSAAGDQPRWDSGGKGLDSYLRMRARKVELTPFGKVRRKHKKLWHGARKKKA